MFSTLKSIFTIHNHDSEHTYDTAWIQPFRENLKGLYNQLWILFPESEQVNTTKYISKLSSMITNRYDSWISWNQIVATGITNTANPITSTLLFSKKRVIRKTIEAGPSKLGLFVFIVSFFNSWTKVFIDKCYIVHEIQFSESLTDTCITIVPNKNHITKTNDIELDSKLFEEYFDVLGEKLQAYTFLTPDRLLWCIQRQQKHWYKNFQVIINRSSLIVRFDHSLVFAKNGWFTTTIDRCLRLVDPITDEIQWIQELVTVLNI